MLQYICVYGILGICEYGNETEFLSVLILLDFSFSLSLSLSPSLSLSADIEGWGISPRGAGYLFGSDVVAQVCIN